MVHRRSYYQLCSQTALSFECAKRRYLLKIEVGIKETFQIRIHTCIKLKNFNVRL